MTDLPRLIAPPPAPSTGISSRSWLVRGVMWVFSIIGVLSVLKYAAITLIGMTADTDDDVYSKVFLSPNGHYSAALISRSGGGAIAPMCNDTVVVFNSRMPLEEVVQSKGYDVYSGECDSFVDYSASPDIRWISDSEIRIEFAISANRVDSRQVDLRAIDRSGNVQVRFSAHR
ncbi:hypothetical protein [Pseudomonas sp.]|uniref:hypothetical protein n=1 Tax=Pseudomonas sp. TaxID=306 RepID=UPI002E3340BC|nr:hypothetical protein [Pseudomonas sp.]HEX4549971.1 hypothetical protein [Pseudomonas sp.]